LNNIFNLFSKEELEDLGYHIGITKGLCFEGKRVNCFDLLYELIYDKKEIYNVSKEELLTLLAQLREFRMNISTMFPIVNNDYLDNIIHKFKKIVYLELRKRKEA